MPDDGSTQVSKAEYNDQGRAKKRVDPLGRETSEYDTNDIDALGVKQKNGAGDDLQCTQ